MATYVKFLDLYPATRRLEYGRGHRGQVRAVSVGLQSECTHAHKTISAALECANKSLDKLADA